jgi:hypothetical protein
MKHATITKLTNYAVGKPTLSIAALALGLSVGALQGATIFTDGQVDDSRIDRPDNWSNGLPTGTNAGTVGTGFSTTFFNQFQPADYDVTYNGNSSLSGIELRLDDGTSLTFNDTSSFSSTGVLFIGFDSGSAQMTFNDSATATLSAGMRFGGNDGATGGSLSLSGNSFFDAVGDVLILGDGINYDLTLNDSAVFETNDSSKWFAKTGNALIVNFEQANTNITPSFKILESGGTVFSDSFFQYQIDGVNTTLADSRFVQSNSDGYDILQLTTIPEPSSAFLLGALGLCMALVYRRRRS